MAPRVRGGLAGRPGLGTRGQFLRMFKKGGTVGKTGPAIVHKGELVVPAKAAKKKAVKKAVRKATANTRKKK